MTAKGIGDTVPIISANNSAIIQQLHERQRSFETEITLEKGRLMVSGNCLLHDIHDNVVLTPAADDAMISGAFIGVESDHKGSRCIFPVGKIEGLRFMCLFRYIPWWMTHKMGNYGREIPVETQFLLLEACNGSVDDEIDQPALYIVFLPILEEDFRAVLQGNERNEMEICLESGDPTVDEFEGSHLVFTAAGPNPFDVITGAVKTVEGHLKTFHHREKKEDVLNWFGWCTWDAFYTDVSAKGVRQGLESLAKGGAPPKFVIIDDGWQSVGMDPTGYEYIADNTANFADRLLHIKENHKFQKDGKEGHRIDDPALGLRHIVAEIRKNHSLKYIFVWHAITGYWGGVSPGVAEMEQYESKITYPIPSPGLETSALDAVLRNIIKNGVGLVNPDKVFSFYNELHSYLASAGIDGVKVDAQTILETLGAGYGGRLKLARKYHHSLEASILKNFTGNGIVSCMSHNTDGLYSEKITAVIRASDDFFPRDPASHTFHIATVAYNTVFVGEFMQPDWDMFHSLHPIGEYHGAARAVGGCPIYVSNKPGQHDFDLLKKLVLPDGSVLRAKLPGRPSRDCLFLDPTRDGKSLLKIWNLNDYTGVLGVFNCHESGWCETQNMVVIHNQEPGTITGHIKAKDVEYLHKLAEDDWSGDVITYSHLGGHVVYLSKGASLSITLKAREYEVFTVVPVKTLTNGAKFAPIGLMKMINSGGAIKELNYDQTKENAGISMKVQGCGTFGAYSSVKPKRIMVNSEEVEFGYTEQFGVVSLSLRVPEEELYLWSISIEL